MHPLNNKGILEMNELDCMRALALQAGTYPNLNGKGINEFNEIDCLRAIVESVAMVVSGLMFTPPGDLMFSPGGALMFA